VEKMKDDNTIGDNTIDEETTGKNTTEYSKETYLGNVFNLNRNLITLADNKANIIIRTLAFLIPFIFGLNLYASLGDNIDHISTGLLNGTFIFATILFFGSFTMALSVIYARFGKTDVQSQTTSDLKDMMFWNNITKITPNLYYQYITGLNANQINDDYCSEIYSLAKINKQKFSKYNISLGFLFLGIIVLIFGYICAALTNFF
jgi:hypothetical protein